MLVAVALATTACGQADPTLAAAVKPPEAFPPKGESLAGLQKWLVRNSNLRPEAYVSVGDRYAVAIVGSDYGGSWIRAVQVRIEVVSEDFSARLGGRSAMLETDVDCSGRLARPKTMTVYPGSNLHGEGERLTFPSRWIASGQGAYLEDVIGASCDAKFRRPFDTSPQVATAGPPANPSTGHLVPSSSLGAYTAPPPAAVAPVPGPAPPVVPTAAAPTPPPAPAAPPPRAAVAAAPPAAAPIMRPTPPISTPVAAAAPTAPPRRPPPPAPAPVAPPRAVAAAPAPPPPRPLVVATAPPPRPTTAPPAPAKPPAASASGFAVQVAAVPTMALADQAWADLSSKPPFRGRPRRVQTIAADGKTFYRVMVGGFGDRGAAQAFCADLKQAGRDCLVRAE